LRHIETLRPVPVSYSVLCCEVTESVQRFAVHHGER